MELSSLIKFICKMPTNVQTIETKKNLKGGRGSITQRKHHLSGQVKRMDGKYVTPTFYNDIQRFKHSENVKLDHQESESVDDWEALASIKDKIRQKAKKTKPTKGAKNK
jgi:hypothetical protein